jgi:GrpB-like predicted nucleotidyltransferase (UPF0157 family)
MGLMRNIVVVDYDPEWPDDFDIESQHLTAVLSPVLIAIHHIGSTSIPGLPAKPTVDILAVVRNLGILDECDDSMTNLGYVPKGEFGTKGRRFYTKGSDDKRTHHVHAFELGNPEIDKHIDFRDYLRVHQEQANRYGALKAILAKTHWNDIEAYIEGKTPLINELLADAVQWRQEQTKKA